MAQAGRKPTSSQLRVVEGAHRTTRHGKVSEAEEEIAKVRATFGGVTMPESFKDKPEAAEAWRKYIAPAWWLDASREVTAIAFCELWQEFRDDPKAFTASKHGQLRAYTSELGLTDERQRFGVGRDKTGDPFFDDDAA